jgi:hypothetical protein
VDQGQEQSLKCCIGKRQAEDRRIGGAVEPLHIAVVLLVAGI